MSSLLNVYLKPYLNVYTPSKLVPEVEAALDAFWADNTINFGLLAEAHLNSCPSCSADENVNYWHMARLVLIHCKIIDEYEEWLVSQANYSYKCQWNEETHSITIVLVNETQHHIINNSILSFSFSDLRLLFGISDECGDAAEDIITNIIEEHWPKLSQYIIKHLVAKHNYNKNTECSLYCFADYEEALKWCRSLPQMAIKLVDIKARTQKVQGLLELRQTASVRNSFDGGRIKCLTFDVITSREALDKWITRKKSSTVTYFARPCPTTPQHGFVDSCQVTSPEMLVNLWKRALSADPDAEMLLCPYVDAKYNMIWANGKLTIGPGHDGATSGHKSIVFPTVNQPPIKPKFKPWQSVKESPYFEFVCKDRSYCDKVTVTQLRDGPAIAGGEDFVPAAVKVKTVRRAEGDLIEWQKICKTLKAGTVVWHPEGSMSSHYGVHCYNNNLPILTSRKPKVGEILKPTIDRPLGRWNTRAFLAGVECGMDHLPANGRFNALDAMLNFALCALHNSAGFDRTNEMHMRMLGFAATMLVRLGFIASYGESRHYRFIDVGKVPKDRSYIYREFWNKFPLLHEHAWHILEVFLDYKNWSNGYGGRKWAKCQVSTINMWNAICALTMRGKQRTTIPQVMDFMNVVVNIVHNGGKYLNKFGGSFDLAAQNSSAFAVELTDTIYPVYKLIAAFKPTPKFNPTMIEVPEGTEKLLEGNGIPQGVLPTFVLDDYKQREKTITSLNDGNSDGSMEDCDCPSCSSCEEDVDDCTCNNGPTVEPPTHKPPTPPTLLLHVQYDFDGLEHVHFQYVTDVNLPKQNYNKHLAAKFEFTDLQWSLLKNPNTLERHYSLAMSERAYIPMVVVDGAVGALYDATGELVNIFDFRTLPFNAMLGTVMTSEVTKELIDAKPKPKKVGKKLAAKSKGKKIEAATEIDLMLKEYAKFDIDEIVKEAAKIKKQILTKYNGSQDKELEE